MESRVVNSTIMTLQHILHSRKVVKGVKCTRGTVRGILAKTRDIPDADGLVLGRRNNQVLLGVELRRHNIVRMSSKNGNAVSRCTVPDPNGLVV
jgi:hypothetical protein